LGQYLDGFSACFSRQPQGEAASQYLDGLPQGRNSGISTA
jgi:hypothetical protein